MDACDLVKGNRRARSFENGTATRECELAAYPSPRSRRRRLRRFPQVLAGVARSMLCGQAGIVLLLLSGRLAILLCRRLVLPPTRKARRTQRVMSACGGSTILLRRMFHVTTGLRKRRPDASVPSSRVQPLRGLGQSVQNAWPCQQRVACPSRPAILSHLETPVSLERPSRNPARNYGCITRSPRASHTMPVPS